MGREIRNVSKDWTHPKDEQGNYIPMLDQTYSEAYDAWLIQNVEWETGEHFALQKDPSLKKRYENYTDWVEEPQPEWFRPPYQGPATCYQIYDDEETGGEAMFPIPSAR